MLWRKARLQQLDDRLYQPEGVYSMPENQSEVARLRQEIETMCFSMSLALHGFAHKTSHRIINNQYKSLNQQRDRLATIIGEEAATETVYDIYNAIVQ